MCALLMMSSEQIVGRLQAHGDVKRPDTSLHTAIAAVPMLRLLTCTAQSCRQAGRTIRHKSIGFKSTRRLSELSLDERCPNKRTPWPVEL